MSKELRSGKKDYAYLAYLYCKPMFYFGTNAFYKRFQMDKPEVFQENVATVVVLNHANAFMDPIACALNFNFRGFYMARGDAFKNKIMGSLLYGIGILPIFRMSDGGRAGLLQNDVSYKAFSNHLNRNRLIQIFPEAICVWEKKLRPIKKGTARMILNYLRDNNKSSLKIQPIGLNYSCASKLGSDLFIKAGEPIDAGHYLADFLVDENRAMIALTKDIENSMSPLLIQVNNENETVFNILEVILKNEADTDDLSIHFERSRKLGIWMNQASESNANWNEFKSKVIDYNKDLKSNGYRDNLFTESAISKLGFSSTFLKFIFLFLAAPIFLLGIIFNGLPYYFIKYFVKKKVNERIFEASAKILLGAILFQINLILMFFTAYIITKNWWYALLTLLLAIFSGWFSLRFSTYFKKCVGFVKLYFNRNASFVKRILASRKEILSVIDRKI
jgi:glycerol-3-phosphate O-acyltransferase / dihydroxyacetone phosphate acyltransferase